MVRKSVILWVWSQLLVWSGEYDPNILYDPIFLDHKFPWSREYDLSNYHDPRFSRFSPMVLNGWYSLGIYIFLHKRNRCRTKVLWVLKCGEVGGRTNENQNPPMYDSFWFFVQNFIFCGAGCSFWYIFTHFLNYKEK